MFKMVFASHVLATLLKNTAQTSMNFKLVYAGLSWFMLLWCWFSWSPSMVMLIDQHTSIKTQYITAVGRKPCLSIFQF